MELFVRKIIPALAIPILGLIFFNLTIAMGFFLLSVFDNVFHFGGLQAWHPQGLAFVAVISAGLLKSQLRDENKAIFAFVLTAYMIASTSMLLWQWPVMGYLAGVLIYSGILAYLFWSKRSWVYFYSVSAAAAVILGASIL